MKILLSSLLTLSFVLVAPLQSGAAQERPCQVIMRVDDSLRFKPATIEVPATCGEFKVVLRHVGRLPKVASPRNWVLVKASDADAVARAGGAAGPEHDYVKPGDARVLAKSLVIGRDEMTKIEVPVDLLEPGETYTYLSTIPGFSPALRGSLTVQPAN